ncbi:MAG: ArsR/SmtB family transcription factor [Brevundimonas sp.]
MESSHAVAALSALAHPGRGAAFRRLVLGGPVGLAAGEVARGLGAPANTTSTLLATLTQAGLARSRRDGRSILYSADTGRMGALVAYLVADCCDGAPAVCAPITEALARAACPCPADGGRA